MMKTKILVLTSTFPRGGNDHVPGFVNELCHRLESHFNIFVLAPYASGTKKIERRGNITIIRFRYWFGEKDYLTDKPILPVLAQKKMLWLLIPGFICSQFINMVAVIKKEKINIIHAHWIIPQGLLAVFFKVVFANKINVFVTSHGGDLFGLRKLKFLKKWIVNHCSALSVVSNHMKAEVESWKIKSDALVRNIPMGVDLNQFHPDRYDESIKAKYGIKGPFLLFVGRFTPKKGIRYLIESMPEILASYPDAKLLLIGYGDEKNKLEQLAKDLHLLNKNIIFAGEVPNRLLPNYYATADIFIGPSTISKDGDREGFGLVFVEAIGCGCITVASDLPSISDIIIPEKTGYTVKINNRHDIARKVLFILNNPDKQQQIIKAARQHVTQHFDWQMTTEKYKSLLSSAS